MRGVGGLCCGEGGAGGLLRVAWGDVGVVGLAVVGVGGGVALCERVVHRGRWRERVGPAAELLVGAWLVAGINKTCPAIPGETPHALLLAMLAVSSTRADPDPDGSPSRPRSLRRRVT